MCVKGAISHCATRPKSACAELLAATKEHHAAAVKARSWVGRITLDTRAWPYVACAACGALIVVHFLKP
jgi:hypothetical protein